MQPKTDNEQMGRLIQQLRTAQGLTQRELGAAVGVSDKAVSKWERGLSFPDITLLPGLAATLGVGVDELISGRPAEAEEDTGRVAEVVDQTVAYTRKSDSRRRKLVAMQLAVIFSAVTVATCLIVNLAVQRTVSWALYPIGALALVLAVLYVALFAGRWRAEAIILVAAAGCLLYLLLVQRLAGGPAGWALTIAAPIIGVVAVLSYGVVLGFKHLKNRTTAIALLLVALAVVTLTVNVVLKLTGIEGDNDLSTLIQVPSFLLTALVVWLAGRLKKG